jgi:thiamine kinase
MLTHVNQVLSTEVKWLPLVHLGTTNHLYRGVYQGQEVVLRLNTDKVITGVSRSREADILNLIQGRAWAPVISYQEEHISCDDQHGWLLMKCYSAQSANVCPGHLKSQLLACVSDWQQIDNAPLFDYTALWDSYQSKINGLADVKGAQVLLNSIQGLMGHLAVIKHCLVHHDLHPGNLLFDADQLVVIDWEYAGRGNPWLDAAALVSDFSCSLDDVASLPAFKNMDITLVKESIHIAQHVNLQLSQLWYLLGLTKSGI